MLESATLRLRAPEPGDLDVLYSWENDTALWHLSNTQKPFSRYTLEQYILNAHLDIYEHKQIRLMIDLKEKGKYSAAGCIDLFDFDPLHRRAGIGLLIDSSYRRRGIAAGALDLVITYARDILQLHQLWSTVTSDNTGSVKLFSGAGFKLCGTRTQWIKKRDLWLDEHMFQLIFE